MPGSSRGGRSHSSCRRTERASSKAEWPSRRIRSRSPARPIDPRELRLDGESDGVAWWPMTDLGSVDLHPGLAASLPQLRPLLTAAVADAEGAGGTSQE